MMERNSFVFDINKCVGCNACAVGCAIHNGTSPAINWRVVNGANLLKHPSLPVFHFSLACNHCEDAPCMKNCPALAYSRDGKTGAILHHAELCIGCKYCTWACPYNAPKFNCNSGVVEKCNFCVDEITNKGKPACVKACPVGALGFNLQEVDEKTHLVPGFVNLGIRPKIQLVPLRDESSKPEILGGSSKNYSKNEIDDFRPEASSKIRLSKEWTLLIFTLIAALLVGIFPSYLSFDYSSISDKIIFVVAGFAAMLLSSAHLGKKLRSWRSVLNLKRSWLSREIVSFSSFMACAASYFFFDYPVFIYIGILFGIISLISIDMVYKITIRQENLPLHSAMVSLTGLLVFSLFVQMEILIGLVALLKSGLYIIRKFHFKRKNQPIRLLLSLVRLSGFFLISIDQYFNIHLNEFVLLGSIALGEIIDRAEFYHEIEVQSPSGKIREFENSTFK